MKADVVDDVGDEIARALDDLGALVNRTCTPAAESGPRNANQAARELLEQRKTIHGLERLVGTLRSDVEARSQLLARSEDRRRGLEGELADVQVKLRGVEAKAKRAEAKTERARDAAACAVADKELAIQRGEDALRRVEHRHARDVAARIEDALCAQQVELEVRVTEATRLEAALAAEREARAADHEKHAGELAERDRALAELFEQQAKVLTEQERAHRSEVAACERALALAAAGAQELEKALAEGRAELAASVAAHARALITAEEKKHEALAERDRIHLQECRARARAHKKLLAERCAKAEEAGQARAAAKHAGIVTTMMARLRDVEQALASARAKHAREVTELRLKVAGLREAAAAEQRLAEYAVELHERARAELGEVRCALEVATHVVMDVAAPPPQSRDTLDESGVRLACGRADEDDEDGERDGAHEVTAWHPKRQRRA
ncbi:MAG: hypothetical protein JWP87_270 [Labilithrix sp.]|nr:hypothetical protein [Labilithrix sp.]